ncbi:hypothetical protein [Pseudarthrobacter sp. NPDC058119]|uniref:hypothetical protein n=1 Tax=Pseudarthrobacter sp. NPDC058119 TaxID=3346348 RepID=UPI0036D80E1E
MIRRIWRLLQERASSVANAILRQRYMSLAVTAILLPWVFVASHAQGVYYSRVDVLFLAPPAVVAGNVLQADPAQTLSFAAIVEHQVNAEYPSSAPRSTSAPLYGTGLRNTHAIFIPNSGGQWQLSFSRPMITVEVVADSPEMVFTTMNQLAGRISDLAADLQTNEGIPQAVQITTDDSPEKASVTYVPVRSGNATFALLILTVGLAIGLPMLAERIAIAAEVRRSEVTPRKTAGASGEGNRRTLLPPTYPV